jgi:hypothetical protein
MSDEKAVTPGDVPGDRVAGLSIRKDGTPDQHNPTIIGDRDAALDLTRTQLRQQAASNAGREADQQAAGGDLPAQDVEDPTIADAQKVKDDAVASADKAADAIVSELFDKDQPASSAPGTEQASRSTGKTSTGK